MKSPRSRRTISKFKFPIGLTLVIAAIATLSFCFGNLVSRASTTQSWTFSTPPNYTYDNAKIQISGGVAELKATTTPSWYNSSWTRRKAITITGSTAGAQSDYQVKVNVAYNSAMQANFNDIRFTDSDGTTLLSDWLETETTSTSATFWVKVPNIPASPGTTTIYMYYGNSVTPSNSDGDTTFSFFDDFSATDVVHAINAPSPASGITSGNIPENVVYDSATGKYWWIFQDDNTSNSSIILASASSMSGPWTMESSTVISASDQLCAPDLVKFGSYWYIFYGEGGNKGTCIGGSVNAQKSTSVNGGYSTTGISNPIVTHGASGSWDDHRVLEPYAFEEGSTYYLLYMGENATSLEEKVGIASSNSPDSGWTDYSGNPVLSGDSGWYDTGTDKAADPYEFDYGGVHYVAYSSAKSGKAGWQMALATTTNFKTFTPSRFNPFLLWGPVGAWDNGPAFRGAVSDFGGTYYITYAGGINELGGVSTLNMSFPLDNRITQWSSIAAGGPVWPTFNASTGIVTAVTGTGLESFSTFGTGYALRARALLDSATNYSMIGMRAYVSAPTGIEFYQQAGKVYGYQDNAGSSTATASLGSAGSGSWATFEFDRNGSTSVLYSVNDATPTVLSANVPTAALPVGMFTNSQEDWVLVRKYVNPEPTVSVGTEVLPYDTSNPIIEPKSSVSFTTLSGFSEAPTLNGGTIKYQISNDGGATWYWYNSGWTTTTSGYSETNTASEINANITTFPMGSGQFLWRAYLHSDGTQLVQLNSIDLAFANEHSTTPNVSVGGGTVLPPSFKIDNGAAVTTSSTVTLSFFTSPAVKSFIITTVNGNESSTATSTYEPSLSLNLCAGFSSCTTGPYTVSVNFLDSTGSTIASSSESISYLPAGTAVPPVTPSSTPPVATSTSSTLSIPKNATKAELETLLTTLEKELQLLLKEAALKGITISGISSSTVSSSQYTFTRNLHMWDQGNDVNELQKYLVAEDKGPAAEALAKHGTTDTFGPLTFAALKEFQHAVGITPDSGYFGPITRGYIRSH